VRSSSSDHFTCYTSITLSTEYTMSGMRSYVFFALNTARILSIIGLLLVFSSNVLVIIKDIRAVNAFEQGKQPSNSTSEYITGSTVPNQPAGVFWAILNRLLVLCQVMLLVFSEVESPRVFFERFFPVLGPDFGLGALGIFQTLIGATVLSHHVDEFALISAFFLFSVGCLNMLLGLIFRESSKRKRSLSAYRERTESVLPVSAPSTWRAGGGSDAASVRSDASTQHEKSGYGRQG